MYTAVRLSHTNRQHLTLTNQFVEFINSLIHSAIEPRLDSRIDWINGKEMWLFEKDHVPEAMRFKQLKFVILQNGCLEMSLQPLTRP